MSRSARPADDDDDENDELANQGPRYGFSPKQIQEYKVVFKEFDTNGDGHADADEIITIMRKLDLPSSRADVNKLIAEVDADGNGTIEFDEFLWMIKKLQDQHGDLSKSGGFGAALSGLSRQLFSGSLFKKQTQFDTDAYQSRQAERAREQQDIEEKYLSKETKKKLEQARRQRASTTKM